jgi:hypothetical protein
MNDIKTLHISGRRWFDRTYGNTYHSVMVVFDGVTHYIGYTYGYGDCYIQTAFEWLEQEGIVSLRRSSNGMPEAYWQWAARTGCKYTYDVADVQRKRDLHEGGKE